MKYSCIKIYHLTLICLFHHFFCISIALRSNHDVMQKNNARGVHVYVHDKGREKNNIYHIMTSQIDTVWGGLSRLRY